MEQSWCSVSGRLVHLLNGVVEIWRTLASELSCSSKWWTPYTQMVMCWEAQPLPIIINISLSQTEFKQNIVCEIHSDSLQVSHLHTDTLQTRNYPAHRTATKNRKKDTVWTSPLFCIDHWIQSPHSTKWKHFLQNIRFEHFSGIKYISYKNLQNVKFEHYSGIKYTS